MKARRNKKRSRSSGSSSGGGDSDTSDDRPIRNLRELHYSESMMKVISELKEGKYNNSEFGKLAIKWEERLTKVISNKRENRRAYKEFRKDVEKVLKKHNMGHLINMGDMLNDDHLLAIVLHFATEAEKDVKAGSDGLSKMDWELSACIAFVKEMIGSSIVRQDYRMKHEHEYDDEEKLEEAARAYWKRHKADVIKSICTFDHRFFISQSKDKFPKEVTELAATDKCSVAVLDLIGVMNTSFHYLNYSFVHEGKKMPSIIATTHVFNTAYDGEINTEAELVSACGYIPHPECWLAGYIRNADTYNLELLEYFDGVINRGFGEIFRVVLKKGDGYDLDTNMATRHGLGTLTKEEHRELAEKLLDIRIRGGTTSGLMRQLAKELINAIMTRDRVSLEAAAEMMDDEIMKYKTTKSSANDKDDNVSKAIKALMDHNEKKWNTNDVEKFAEKLSSLYLGSIKTGLMSKLASKMYANGLDVDSTIEDITKRLSTLKDQYSSDESSVSDNDETAAFKALVKHNEDILDGDMALLAKKLYSLQMGSIKTGLMATLAREVYNNIGKQPDEIELDDITKQLESLEKQYDSMPSEDEAEYSDLYKAFVKLMGHSDKNRDMSTLAGKLQALYQGGMTSGAMATLASEMFGSDEGQLPYGSDIEQITDKLEELHEEYTSEAKKTKGDDLYKAFAALIEQQPSITEDLPSLANYINNVAMSNSETYKINKEKMRLYIEENFKPGDTVYVNSYDDQALYEWWSTMTGYAEFKGSIPKSYGKKVVDGSTEMDELKKIGVSFDLEKIKNAITKGLVDRWSKRKNKQKVQSSLAMASLLQGGNNEERGELPAGFNLHS